MGIVVEHDIILTCGKCGSKIDEYQPGAGKGVVQQNAVISFSNEYELFAQDRNLWVRVTNIPLHQAILCYQCSFLLAEEFGVKNHYTYIPEGLPR